MGERRYMYSQVMSGTILGIQGVMIQVETDCSDGLPGFHLVGCLSNEIRESGERIRTAIRNAGYTLPAKKVVVNLSPADMKKSGSGFDLPIAIGILVSLGCIPPACIQAMVIIGELGLDGRILPVTGVLPIADAAKEAGYSVMVVPKENQEEASYVEGLQIVSATTLQELVSQLVSGTQNIVPNKHEAKEIQTEAMADFGELKGLPVLRRAMEIAASGMHNLLMAGPPGSGKTLAAKCLAGILPKLTTGEQMELTKIYSVRGLLPQTGGLIRNRPFRSPHHTITTSSLLGGGSVPKPGELSLAHTGVLFLDELPEFSRNTIEALRQPLEDGSVTIGRLQATCQFPARIMLVAAMNLCPCGSYPNRNRCHCTPYQIQNYQNRVSRAILDRIDIWVGVSPISYRELTQAEEWETSASIRKRVTRVHQLQQERYRQHTFQFNAQLNQRGIEEYCRLTEAGTEFLREIYEGQQLSNRSYYRILKVARTIADMEGSEAIEVWHLQEAAAYRFMETERGEVCG